MTYDAALEQFGGFVATSFAATYQLRLTSGPGLCRCYALEPTGPGLAVLLPIATLCLAGEIITVINTGTDAFTVYTVLGSSVVTIAAGGCADLLLVLNNTLGGYWHYHSRTAVEGTALADRHPIALEFTSTQFDGVDLREIVTSAADTYGWDGESPVALSVRIAPGVVIGSETTSAPAFDTGTWPVGSTCVMHIEGSQSQIDGRGGDGGRGGDAPSGLLPTNGGDGGPALLVQVNTYLFSHGKIRGGGGGGAGSSRSGSVAGSGGGGGAGFRLSNGGAAGSGGGGQPGAKGGIGVAGIGGTSASGYVGGAGGSHGAAGSSASPSGALPGAAGDAIQVVTGYALTKIVAGTIEGAEVTL